jgi:hypothetical protein
VEESEGIDQQLAQDLPEYIVPALIAIRNMCSLG